jgi:prepilin-type processing-associated H-X9-DG protein
VFYGPNDTEAGNPASDVYGAAGTQISVGANALESGGFPAQTFERLGVFAHVNDNPTGGANVAWADGDTCATSQITQPSATILYVDLQSVDVQKVETGNWKGISSASPLVSLIGDYVGQTDVVGSPAAAPALTPPADATNQLNADNPQAAGILPTASDFWKVQQGNYTSSNWELPNPARKPTNAYPDGPNGIISTPFSSKTLANFAFTDGHAKAMKPVATNPDGANWLNGAPDPDNEWLVRR